MSDRELADVFRQVLAGHSALVSPARPTAASAREFQRFLDDFIEVYGRAAKVDAAETRHDLQVFESFFPGYHDAFRRWAEGQRDKADDFNALDVIGVTGKENVHSDILAWLLDPDITRPGTHAQGNLGFRLFLETVGLERELGEFADRDYRVSREPASDESRIDIEVAHRGSFVIHIETKVFAGEGDDQTPREWRDLKHRAKELGCLKHFAIFLSPRGVPARDENFRPISWRTMAKVFEAFAAKILERTDAEGARAVALFATHYAGVLRRHIVQQNNSWEDSDGDEHIQN
jgi:hypothetical protein